MKTNILKKKKKRKKNKKKRKRKLFLFCFRTSLLFLSLFFREKGFEFIVLQCIWTFASFEKKQIPSQKTNNIHKTKHELKKQQNGRLLPFQQFHMLFTLFSKFFSSFPHGTCKLSVSQAYLVTDEIYHPTLKALLPKNLTQK